MQEMSILNTECGEIIDDRNTTFQAYDVEFQQKIKESRDCTYIYHNIVIKIRK